MSRPKGYEHSEETKRKISYANSGTKSSQWKGDAIKYQAIHMWLRRKYGQADRCENKKCSGRSSQFQWALRKGKKYARKRSIFIRLCRSCHRKMDMSDSLRQKISHSLLKYYKNL